MLGRLLDDIQGLQSLTLCIVNGSTILRCVMALHL